MAQISQDTFDPMRRFVRVRLQQGVPIVDADVNEREDIQKFELRAFLKWFVGDGVPEGNDGFRIAGTAEADDFTIKCGVNGSADPLSSIGRCLVQGLDVMIEKDFKYTGQDLHEGRGESATQLAARWNVPVVKALTNFSTSPILIYLDVWERLVTPAEDPSLIYGGLGTESCARLRREWVVRAKEGTTLPHADDPEGSGYKPGHAYTALASIERRAGDALVQPHDVTDLRQRQLLVPPAGLIEDVLGTDPLEYRRGVGRPPISLRDAINALIIGKLPSTPDRAVDTSAVVTPIGRAFVTDRDGLVAFWTSDKAGGQDQVFAARMSMSAQGSGFGSPLQITANSEHRKPHAISLPDGSLLVVYQKGFGSSADILLKRGNLEKLASLQPQTVASTSGVAEIEPFVVLAGDVATIFFYRPSAKRWQYRSLNLKNNQWTNPATVPGAEEQDTEFCAAADPNGRIWVAVSIITSDHSGVARFMQIDPGNGQWFHDATVGGSDVQEFSQPLMVRSGGGDVSVFWICQEHAHTKRFDAKSASWDATEILESPEITYNSLSAAEDPDGGMWLFLSTTDEDETNALVAMRRDPVGGVWGELRKVTAHPGSYGTPFALTAGNATWLFFSSDRDGSDKIYHKMLVTTV